MKYKYQILKLEPKHEFISIRYMHEGLPDYFYNYNPQEFTKEHIERVIRCGSNLAVQFWERVKNHPDSIDVEQEATKEWIDPIIENPPTTFEDPPEHNGLTHYVKQKDAPDEDKVWRWEVIEKSQDQKMESVRLYRDWLLSETDWMVFPDSPEPSQEWLDYRQALRDVPGQEGFPDNVIWPEKPV